jgi:hypothetical protein
MSLSFLGSNGGNDASIGYFVVVGNLVHGDEEDCSGAFGDYGAYSLGKAT